ncbi:L-ascorbate peroxidase/peroxidase [Trypanosoma rangeli]|uniref:L-ascorbate peroxidase/peroxidase n=1 Tax=Trypanosoma rangeli TaxID=5698 RepID=A0A3R7KE98_TRYRA|nr:L-ascorbate peroxidase/peroxidase [Trypanosoma rangeli]RNE98742.1 L-ascorbate peroxidase/peroxidase [Trypanosoma rangeli]|eukprot:RNE98742.1 L-ascorbate peroxidase/peroxidase [Trypanosoma rangeli]
MAPTTRGMIKHEIRWNHSNKYPSMLYADSWSLAAARDAWVSRTTVFVAPLDVFLTRPEHRIMCAMSFHVVALMMRLLRWSGLAPVVSVIWEHWLRGFVDTRQVRLWPLLFHGTSR